MPHMIRVLICNVLPMLYGLSASIAPWHVYLLMRSMVSSMRVLAVQIDAFRGGLSVFLDEKLRETLRQCCTVVDFQVRPRSVSK